MLLLWVVLHQLAIAAGLGDPSHPFFKRLGLSEGLARSPARKEGGRRREEHGREQGSVPMLSVRKKKVKERVDDGTDEKKKENVFFLTR